MQIDRIGVYQRVLGGKKKFKSRVMPSSSASNHGFQLFRFLLNTWFSQSLLPESLLWNKSLKAVFPTKYRSVSSATNFSRNCQTISKLVKPMSLSSPRALIPTCWLYIPFLAKAKPLISSPSLIKHKVSYVFRPVPFPNWMSARRLHLNLDASCSCTMNFGLLSKSFSDTR